MKRTPILRVRDLMPRSQTLVELSIVIVGLVFIGISMWSVVHRSRLADDLCAQRGQKVDHVDAAGVWCRPPPAPAVYAGSLP